MAENSDDHGFASRLETVQRRDETRPRRLELPIFSGDNPYGWLNRAKRYFHFNGIGDEDTLEAAAVCLDGKALNWFQWWEAITPIITWDIFRVAILHRFTPSQLGNLYEVLLGLQQTGSIAQYREDFELLYAPLKDAADEVLIGIFINGLRDEIKAELRLSKLGSLAQIMDHNQRIEEKNWALSQVQLPRNQRVAPPRISPNFSTVESSRSANTTGSSVRPTPTPFVPLRSTPTTAPRHFYKHKRGEDVAMGIESSLRRGGPYKRLSNVEYHEKLKKGLCFHCDEKYSPNHRCNSKQFNLLIVTAEDDDEDIDGLPRETPRSDTDHLHGLGQQGTEKLLELSLQSIIGFTSKKSLKIIQDYFLFNLGSADVILGLEWLETLGDIQANFKTLTLKFKVQGQTKVIRGDRSLSKSVVSLKTLFKALQEDGEGTIVDGSAGVLIKWKDLSDFENSWESYEVISAQFPNFPPEDKVKFVGI
ncbi:hypothetical protein V6N12_012804 [Hibiscus sabdariffa]|uniref:Retrotransposon gag domain-containing protein n=1 Tax=Hibiscus sabdariffa TaxID=183260 RepID=A0ABR2EH30_9ROSI